jgi:phosphoglycerate dehydrogenase-like enzyme
MNRASPAETKLLMCVWHPFAMWRPTAEAAAALRQRWPDMNVVHLPDFERLSVELPDADIFVGYSLRPEQLKFARKLKWIHSTAAGVAQLTYPELRNARLIVTNARGIFSTPMAEHVMGTLVALARNFPAAMQHQARSHWAQQDLWNAPQRLTELNGASLLIVGYGSIGHEVARLAKAFGMRVTGVTRSGNGEPGAAERIVPVTALDRELPNAGYVVIAAPETAETQHLFDAARLARMKRGARLINVARGSLVDEAALVAALESGALGGAALDVAAKEPLPPDDPLWRAPNLLLTPHVSAVSDRLWARETRLLVDLLDRWFAGQELFNLVDLSRGY